MTMSWSAIVLLICVVANLVSTVIYVIVSRRHFRFQWFLGYIEGRGNMLESLIITLARDDDQTLQEWIHTQVELDCMVARDHGIEARIKFGPRVDEP